MKINLLLITVLTIVYPSMFLYAIEAPSLNEVFAQQIKCNSSYFNNSLWEKEPILFQRMDTHTYTVISNPVITEVPPKIHKNVAPEYIGMKERAFKAKATRYVNFKCSGKDKAKFIQTKESPVETLVEIFETKTGTGKFHIGLAEPDEIPGADKAHNLDFLTNPTENPDESGMYCVVLVNDFIKNSNAINIDKLCEGKSAKDREDTKQAIAQVRKTLKAAGLGKTK